jgi:hypothetical protein
MFLQPIQASQKARESVVFLTTFFNYKIQEKKHRFSITTASKESGSKNAI